ncbi:MAG: FlaD/FlaE family flagellar protein [Candidatus Micrarchaeota archaeon]
MINNTPEQVPNPGLGLNPEQLKSKLSRYVGSLPSTVIEELYQTLKPMSLPEKKIDEIIEKTLKTYSGEESSSRMNELVDKMGNLEETLIHSLKAIEHKQEKLMLETNRAIGESADREHDYAQSFRQQPPPSHELEPSPEPPPMVDPEPKLQKRRSIVEKAHVQYNYESDNALLPDIPDDAISNAIVLKWVEFLLETVGHQNLPEVLDYYVDISWISEKVTMKLLAYSSGMVAPRGRSKEKLSTKDHLRSLLFIEKLRGKDFDQSQLTKLEREIRYTIEKRLRKD